MQANKFIVDPITLPSNADNLDKCLATMVEGFQAVIDKLEEKPVAISFAVPGPADYPNGIIGGYLPNFPSFREGVALGPFLEYKFGIPVFINNDGDLFAYGEALGGALPEVNARLEALGSPKRYKNLVGYTFGTGLGMIHLRAPVMPPPMTIRPSISVTAVAMASPAISPISAKALRAASVSPSRFPSAISQRSFGSSPWSGLPDNSP